MPDLHEFTDANFAAAVLASPEPVLVDFTAEWCAPCRQLAPVVEKLNAEWNGAVKVGTLDVDQNSATAVTYGVLSIPTLILFKAGRPAERVNGLQAREKILAKLQPHL